MNMHRLCANIGLALVCLSSIAIIALLIEWKEFGEWNKVLTCPASIAAGVFVLGMALFWFGDQ
jgi:hypothetical protein